MDTNSQPYDSGSEGTLVPLRVMGISYSQIQTGVYALILAQTDGPFRIPVMIGAPEAQAIAMKMESVTPPRPMTHDLFSGVWKAFGIRLLRVVIYRFEDGVFYSELRLSDGSREVSIDSRTSDAVAIAMRTGSPIFCTPDVLQATGFEMEVEEVADRDGRDDRDSQMPDTSHLQDPPLERLAAEELERMLATLIEQENYEEAAKVSDILRRKRGEGGDNNH